MHMTRIARLLTISVLVLSAPTLAHGGDEPKHGTYRIVPGDVLDVIVWRNKELSLQVTVRPDGWISYPLASDVKVAGATVVDVQKKLEEALAKYVTSPTVTVVVTRVANLRVSILGKVRQPGRYNLDGPTTVLDVLALAGGLTEFADHDGIYVLRAGATADALYERIPAKYSSSTSAGKSNTNVTVVAGDIIIVP
jgi:polysaccharide export outer membrane protein